MVAAPRTASPLFQQQESPSDYSLSPSPTPSLKKPTTAPPAATAQTAPAAAPTATSAAVKPALNSQHALLGDHSQEQDIAVHVEEPPKDLADAPAQAVAADARALPADAVPRRPCWRDPFGWVLRPRAISRHQRIVLIIFGRIGWCAKAIIYSIIGGLCCKSSVEGRQGTASASPQGAFILIGNNQVGVPLLVVIAVMLALYAGWRFWEGIVGAGTDAEVGRAKNFFRYRLSPIVSGGVYLAYMAYILSLLAKNRLERLNADNNQSFPNSWRNSDGGKFGLALIGIAFVCAFFAQLEMIVTTAFHRELRPDLPRFWKWFTYVAGHIGFSGRAGTFLLVAILFFRTIGEDTGNETTIANALYQLQGNAGGRFALFLLGWGLIVYGLYATMCGFYVRVFPTKPRSSNPIAPLQHARHLWNKRRQRKLDQKTAIMKQTLGLQMGDSNRGQVNGHANGRAVPNGGANGVTSSWAASPVQPTFDRPTFGSPQQPIVDGLDAGYPPSRVYVPPGGVTQI